MKEQWQNRWSSKVWTACWKISKPWGCVIEPSSPIDGGLTGWLWPLTRRQGLSLGDRACLTLGLRLGLTVVTCDQAWAQLPIELEIQLLR